MRKTLLITLFTLVVIGCKEKSTNDEATTNEVNKLTFENKCKTSFEEFEKIPEADISTRVLWLYNNGPDICKKNLFEYTFCSHQLPKGQYPIYVSRYGRNQIPLLMTWKEIRSIIKDTTRANYYKYYITFNQTENDELKMILTKKFTQKSTCYSIPLFLSIADSLDINDNDEKAIFEFSKSIPNNKKIKTNPYIIFKVTNPSNKSPVVEFEMNYSTKPQKEYLNPL